MPQARHKSHEPRIHHTKSKQDLLLCLTHYTSTLTQDTADIIVYDIGYHCHQK